MSAFGTVPVEVLPPHLQAKARSLLAAAEPRPRRERITASIESTEDPSDVGVRLVRLPWSALLPDNRKYAPALRGKKPVMLLTADYRAAKRRAAAIASEQLAEQQPLRGPLQFTAVMYEPNHHARDVQNYSKLVCDALKGIAYDDDRQIEVASWRCAGTDVDAPRLEITITKFTRGIARSS